MIRTKLSFSCFPLAYFAQPWFVLNPSIGVELRMSNVFAHIGNTASGWKPVRNNASKYFITEEQYKEEGYPTFVTGPSYVVSKAGYSSLLFGKLANHTVHCLTDISCFCCVRPASRPAVSLEP